MHELFTLLLEPFNPMAHSGVTLSPLFNAFGNTAHFSHYNLIYTIPKE